MDPAPIKTYSIPGNTFLCVLRAPDGTLYLASRITSELARSLSPDLDIEVQRSRLAGDDHVQG